MIFETSKDKLVVCLGLRFEEGIKGFISDSDSDFLQSFEFLLLFFLKHGLIDYRGEE